MSTTSVCVPSWPPNSAGIRADLDDESIARHRADPAKARQLREQGITATDIAKMLGVSRATAYRYLADVAPLPA